MTERAELYPALVGLVVAIAVTTACRQDAPARVAGVYTHDSRSLVRLDTDYDGDGRIDARTYMRSGQPIRVEADGNRDGIVDRWEYYDRAGVLVRIGASTRADGLEDTWVRSTGDERVVEIATRRDGVVDRREFYRRETLLRIESDTDADGHVDHWQELEQGRVARVLVDESRAHQGPTRRIVYRRGAEPLVEAIEPKDAHAAR